MKVFEHETTGEKVIALRRWTSHAKEWAGLILKPDQKYKWSLSFCKVVERDWSKSGKNGTTYVALQGKGYYRVSNPKTGCYGRDAIAYYYWDGESEEMVEVDEKEVREYFEKEGR